MDKTLEDYFTDWEGHVFGFGYGTGEVYTVQALKHFLLTCPEEGAYDYQQLEKPNPTVAWLMLNTLCHVNLIDYGTSPRFGWLTSQGQKLRAFIKSKTTDELYELTGRLIEEYIPCYPDVCNCDGPKCNNPFW